MNGIGEYYVINHIVMFTGLSERTIRSHIAAGFLKGEKINGLWHFTPEEVENFINHPSVKPGILAKSNSLVYDFLSDTGKKADEMVVILDIPGESKIEISKLFCREICDGDYKNIKFSFSDLSGINRIIISGGVSGVLKLLEFYKNTFK